MTAAMQTKLAGLATNAELRDRSTHTGTQALDTLTQSGATTGQVPQWSGTAWVPAAMGLVGLVQLASLPGVVTGAGVTSQQRQDNCTAVNAALVTAAAAGNIAFFPAGEIEIEGTNGIVVPDLCRWLGTTKARITQFTNGVPVMTIGNPASSASVNRVSVDGVWLRYGASQVGQSAGAGLQGVRAWMSEFRNIDIGDVYSNPSDNPKYIRNGILFSGATLPFLFSCKFENIRIRNYYNYGIYQNVKGTGNIWSNIHISNGDAGASAGTVNAGSAFCAFRLGNSSGGAAVEETTINQLNIEWSEFTGSGSAPFILDTARGVAASSIHVEGCAMGTSCTGMFKVFSGSTLEAQAITIQNCGTTTTNATPRGLFSVGTSSRVRVGRLRHAVGIHRTLFDATPVAVVRADATSTRNASCAIDSYDPAGVTATEPAQITLCESTSTSLDFATANSWRSRILKRFGEFLPLPEFNDSTQVLGDANITMYSDWARDTLCTAPLTTGRTVTLAAVIADSNSLPYSVIPVPTGQRRTIRRTADSTGASALSIVNGGPGAGTLAALATGEWVEVVFNGTNWLLLAKGSGVG
jgi:hypothetical protein